jgi:two-component system LytT family response regulator
MLRTLLIDDEAHNRDTLRKLLTRHCPQVSVAGEASGVADGIKAIKKFHPDLIILDINMGDGSGFDLLHALTTIDFNVIFISAFNKNTIQAFRLSGIEFLMKPVSPVELMCAVNKAEASDPRDLALKLKALEANIRM